MTKTFYSSRSAPLDSVMMEPDNGKPSTSEQYLDYSMTFLVAGALLVIGIGLTRLESTESLESSCFTKKFLEGKEQDELKFCFVKYYSIVSESQLNINDVHHCLSYSHLQRQSLLRQEDISSSSRVYGLSRIQNSRGLVSVVRAYCVFKSYSLINVVKEGNFTSNNAVDEFLKSFY